MAVSFVSRRPPIVIKRYLFLSSAFSVNHRYFSDDSKKKNLYEILGIPRNATSMEIKKAYYDITLKYHPDRNVGSKEAALKFREASEAYEILGNYGLRKKYDRGVSVSSVTKTIEHAVDHRSQYQEFYDSRSSKHGTDSKSRTENIKELGSYSQKKNSSEIPDKPEESHLAVQIVFSIFLIIIAFISR